MRIDIKILLDVFVVSADTKMELIHYVYIAQMLRLKIFYISLRTRLFLICNNIVMNQIDILKAITPNHSLILFNFKYSVIFHTKKLLLFQLSKYSSHLFL